MPTSTHSPFVLPFPGLLLPLHCATNSRRPRARLALSLPDLPCASDRSRP
uniref:Uncharacterized protein n=1 Tax=Arundo donax TaxID=35708 RepID=A0A0A9EMY9_ARUDO